MSKEFDVHYGEQEFKTVKCGIEAIRSVLTGDDVHSKERLLFYLDWYMDPYYKNDLSALGEPLKELLQETVVANKDADIVDEALYLLEAYTTGPYALLEKNKNRIPEEFKPKVLYLLNESSW